MTPLRSISIPAILNGDLQPDLRRFEFFGPHRDYFNADYLWQIGETTSLLSNAFFDVHEGTFEQFDFGFSRTRLPDLTYYLGTRYLRNTQVLDKHGSNAFVFAASYVLDERYSVVFSQQYDFAYRANVDSELAVIRRYHRLFWSLSLGTDASLGRQSIVFSIWPQGVPELSLGSRRYTALTQP
jgi:hypothetical protein